VIGADMPIAGFLHEAALAADVDVGPRPLSVAAAATATAIAASPATARRAKPALTFM
jgi:hypothetical protein